MDNPKVFEIEPSPTVKPAAFEREIYRTAKGSSILAAGRLFNFVARFVITIIMTRLLQAEQYGLYNIATSVAAITAGLSKFGLDTALMRYIAIMNSRKDRSGLWGAIQVGIGASLLLSVVINAGLFFLAYPIAENGFGDIRLAPLLQVAAFLAPFLTQSEILAGATRGFKNMRDTVVAQNFIQPGVRLVLIAVLAISNLTVTEALIAFGLADLGATIVLVYYLNKHFSLRRSLSSAKRNSREILGFSLPLWLSDLLTTFRGNLQTLLVGSLNTVSGAGIFTVVNQVVLFGNIIHASVNTSARPLIAELHDRRELGNLNRLYQTSTKWVLTLNLPLLLIVVLFPQQLLQVFGRSFEAGAAALVIMALVNLVNVSTGMCNGIIEMTGYAKLKLVNSVIRISVAIAANVLLIPRYGILGAAYAALIHEIVANLLPLVEVWILFRAFPFNLSFIKPLVATAAAFAASTAVRLIVPVEVGPSLIETLPPLAIHAAIILVVYAGVNLLLGLSDDERAMLAMMREKTSRRLTRKKGQ